jgi:hypothetical protein
MLVLDYDPGTLLHTYTNAKNVARNGHPQRHSSNYDIVTAESAEKACPGHDPGETMISKKDWGLTNLYFCFLHSRFRHAI